MFEVGNFQSVAFSMQLRTMILKCYISERPFGEQCVEFLPKVTQ